MTKAERVQAEFSRRASEEVRVEEIGGAFYAFGSELATLRLLKAYRHCGDRAEQGYSDNLETHYFRLEFANEFVGFDVPKA